MGMKEAVAILFAALALAGCDKHNAAVEDQKDSATETLNNRKEAIDDATSAAKKEAGADAKAEKARIDAEQEKAKAQIEADKKKVDAEAKAEKADHNAHE
jgi:hypothetical protein